MSTLWIVSHFVEHLQTRAAFCKRFSVAIQHKLLQATECELFITGLKPAYSKTSPSPSSNISYYLKGTIAANKLAALSP